MARVDSGLNKWLQWKLQRRVDGDNAPETHSISSLARSKWWIQSSLFAAEGSSTNERILIIGPERSEGHANLEASSDTIPEPLRDCSQ